MAHSKFVGDTDHALSAITSPLYELENKHILHVTSLFLVAEVLVSWDRICKASQFKIFNMEKLICTFLHTTHAWYAVLKCNTNMRNWEWHLKCTKSPDHNGTSRAIYTAVGLESLNKSKVFYCHYSTLYKVFQTSKWNLHI